MAVRVHFGCWVSRRGSLYCPIANFIVIMIVSADDREGLSNL